MTMIRRVLTAHFSSRTRHPVVCVTRWTEHRRMPPPLPAWDDDAFDLTDVA